MRHVPVLLSEVIDALNLKKGMQVIDCTAGDAGHSEAILNMIGPSGSLLALDADPESVLRAKKYLHTFGGRATVVRENFIRLREVALEQQVAPADAILFDLGWSSPQFAQRGRGFSFQEDEPLDMRYGAQTGLIVYGEKDPTAADLLNTLDEDELAKIFKTYGEEKLSKEIASAVVETRKSAPIKNTKDLVELVLQVYRKKLKTDKEVPWVGGLHPATKVFQALRIAVNDELGILPDALEQAIEVLRPGGRLAVITFHSGEDRIVKHFFKSHTAITVINKKPIVASEQEAKENPRARSAKLRVVEKHL